MNLAGRLTRRMLKWVIGLVVVATLVLVGGPYIYIHFIEGPAPKPLSLPRTTVPTGASGTTVAFPSGRWDATSGSQVGYRVDEVLVGQDNVAVGRTRSVVGSLTLAGTQVSAASFTVQMATVHSDQSQRDNQFDGRIMNVAAYPTSTFTLTSPIALGSTAPDTTITASATGALTLHGQTHRVTFPVSASYTGKVINISGSIPILFATWGIANPSFGSFVTTDNHGTLEFLLVLHAGAS